MTVCDFQPVFGQSVLTVGLGEAPTGPGRRVVELSCLRHGAEALERMRIDRFDLVLAGTDMPDMSWSAFAQRMRAAWPWQKWALAGLIGLDEERLARQMNVAAIFDAAPTASELEQLCGKRRLAVGRSEVGGADENRIPSSLATRNSQLTTLPVGSGQWVEAK